MKQYFNVLCIEILLPSKKKIFCKNSDRSHENKQKIIQPHGIISNLNFLSVAKQMISSKNFSLLALLIYPFTFIRNNMFMPRVSYLDSQVKFHYIQEIGNRSLMLQFIPKINTLSVEIVLALRKKFKPKVPFLPARTLPFGPL